MEIKLGTTVGGTPARETTAVGAETTRFLGGETTKLSTKGQIILPKNIRDARAWTPGTEFTVEAAGDGVLLRPAGRFPTVHLDQVAGCLRFEQKPKTMAEMQDAIGREVIRRHGRS